jgi:hypothetical protein
LAIPISIGSLHHSAQLLIGYVAAQSHQNGLQLIAVYATIAVSVVKKLIEY